MATRRDAFTPTSIGNYDGTRSEKPVRITFEPWGNRKLGDEEHGYQILDGHIYFDYEGVLLFEDISGRKFHLVDGAEFAPDYTSKEIEDLSDKHLNLARQTVLAVEHPESGLFPVGVRVEILESECP